MSEWQGGAGNNDWDNAANWSPNGVPAPYVNVTVSTVSTITLDVNVNQTGALDLTGTSGTVVIDGNGVNTFNFGILEATFGETLVLSQTNLKLGTGIFLSGTSGAFTVEDGSINDNTVLDLTASEQFVLVDTTLTQDANIIGAGTLVLDGAVVNNSGAGGPSAVIDFDTVTTGPGNTLEIQPYALLGQIENFGQGDTIVVGSGNTLTLKSNGNGTYSLVENTFVTLTNNVTLAPGLTPADFTSNNGTFYYACFLSGTDIATIDGDVAVEDIRPGDELRSGLEGGAPTQRVTWTGQHYVDLTGKPDDDHAYPVRFLADSIADGVPARDLLVTSEHCMFLNGVLVPARMLVNGRSILIDKTRNKFHIHHIETETHSILLANGAPSETYLDTGNRKSFAPADASNIAFASFGAPKSWETDAAAPLATNRAIVEPIFRALEARAMARGIAQTMPAPTLTNTHDLSLVTPSGETHAPVGEEDGVAYFMLPASTNSVRLRSRRFRPADVIGPFVDDRRDLGVQIGQITLHHGGTSTPLDTHLTTQTLDGWHAIEPGHAKRWTNGDAHLPLPRPGPNDVSILLSLELTAAGPYRDVAPDEAKARSA